MRLKIKKGQIIIAVMTIAVIMVLFLTGIKSMNNRIAYQSSIYLSENWTMILNGERKENVNIADTVFAPISTGDVMTISRVIPDFSYDAPMMRMWMCHSAFEVRLDGDVIYSYGFDELEKKKIIGTGYHWINLPDECQGQELSITIYPGEKDALTNIDTVILGEASDAYPDFISDTIMNISAGIFLVIFGISIIVITVCLKVFSVGFTQLLYAGVFSILIGTWTLCNKGDIQLISSNRVLNQFVEHGCLYLGLIPILLFMNSIRSKDKGQTRKSRIMYYIPRILIIMNVVLFLTSVILQITNIYHFTMLVSYYHVFMCISVAYILISCVQEGKKGNIQEILVLIGVIVMGGCFLTDIVIFTLAKFFNGTLSRYMGISAWGCIAFCLCMLASYCVYVYRGICSHVEKESLLNMAYTDHLTKLANTAKYRDMLDQFENDHSAFTVIAFDLNNLKYVNDHYGHEEGNVLLCTFAGVLRNAFDKQALVSRTGGDEFVVLLAWENQEKCQALINKYELELEKVNRRPGDYEVSAAWGIAYRSEIPDTPLETILELADSRMYEKKRMMKEQKNT